MLYDYVYMRRIKMSFICDGLSYDVILNFYDHFRNIIMWVIKTADVTKLKSHFLIL
jgi:hypothetical protein